MGDVSDTLFSVLDDVTITSLVRMAGRRTRERLRRHDDIARVCQDHDGRRFADD